MPLTPSLTITGEYNDNVFQNNDNKGDDCILGFTPGIAFSVESSTYRLIASYNFTAEIYADQDQLNDAFARQTLLIDGSYRISPAVTLTLSEAFYTAKNSNPVSWRRESCTRSIRFGASYRFTPTLTEVLTAGPTVVVPEDDSTSVTPVVTASLQQRFSWGFASRQ